MRKYIMISLLCALLTSCYSYKKINLHQEELVIGKKYKIHRIEKSTQKGKLHSINDSLITLNNHGELHSISLKEVERIKKRKFSWGKTIALPVGVLISVAGIAIAVDGGVGVGNINFEN